MASSKVLIIEDEQPLRDAFALLLKHEGYKVELAENGKIALKKLVVFDPDVILLDLLMPVMDGKIFLKKAKLRSKKLPKIVILSNLSDPFNITQAKEYGVYQTVLKADLSPAQLVNLIQKALT